VPSRLAARLLTGPAGFLVAGTLDVTAAWGRYAAMRIARRLGR
jgi:hypothetical protein